MSPGWEHSETLDQMRNALHILTHFCPGPVHVSREVGITGIPRHVLASEHRTSTLAPDLAVWDGAAPTVPHPSYQYGRDGVPRLVLEVISQAFPQIRAQGRAQRRLAYARLGVGEYWLMDTLQASPLSGYTLDAGDGTGARGPEYRCLGKDHVVGQVSRVLATSLRWVAGTLECWHAPWARWVPVGEIPVLQERTPGRDPGPAEGGLVARMELLLAMDVPLDIAQHLGVDMLCLPALPGIGDLMQTQGDLFQLRRYIPLGNPGRDVASDRDYVDEMMRACRAPIISNC